MRAPNQPSIDNETLPSPASYKINSTYSIRLLDFVKITSLGEWNYKGGQIRKDKRKCGREKTESDSKTADVPFYQICLH